MADSCVRSPHQLPSSRPLRERELELTGKILTTLSPLPVQNVATPPCLHSARTAAGILPAFRRGILGFAFEPDGGGIGGGAGCEGEVMR